MRAGNQQMSRNISKENSNALILDFAEFTEVGGADLVSQGGFEVIVFADK